MQRFYIVFLLFCTNVPLGALAHPCETLETSSPTSVGWLDVETTLHLASQIRRKLFENPEAPLPELAGDVRKLDKTLKSLSRETTQVEIESYLKAETLGISERELSELINEFKSSQALLYRRLISETQVLLSDPRLITYERWHWLVYRASIVATQLSDTFVGYNLKSLIYKLREELGTLGEDVKKPNELGLVEWELSSFQKSREQLAEIIKVGPRHMLLPVFESLGLAEIQKGYDQEVSFAELKLGISRADGVEYNASTYYDHDINHAHRYLEADSLLNWQAPSMSASDFDQTIKMRRKFWEEVSRRIFKKTNDPRAYIGFRYAIFHERIAGITDKTSSDPMSALSTLSLLHDHMITGKISKEYRTHFQIPNDTSFEYARDAFEIMRKVAEEQLAH